MIRLYLVRHAEAAELGEGGATRDADRELTPKGRRQAKRLATFLRAMGIIGPVVASSPLLRAMQTARVLALGLESDDVVPLPSLAPGGNAEDVLQLLRSLKGRDLVAVGHMPDMARVSAWLLGAPESSGIEFKKAGAAALRFDGRTAPGLAALEWLVHPRLIKAGGP